MANVRYTTPIDALVGSQAAVTHQRAQAGTIVRTRTHFAGPNSLGQATAKMLLGRAAWAWSNTLTAANRASWDAAALTATWYNSAGLAFVPKGRMAYLRHHILWTYLGYAVRTTAPAIIDTPTPAFTLAMTATVMQITDFGGIVLPAPTRVAVWRSEPYALTINYPRPASIFLGTVVVSGPPATPLTLFAHTGWPSAGRYFVRLRLVELGNDPGPPIVSHNGTCSWEQVIPITKP